MSQSWPNPNLECSEWSLWWVLLSARPVLKALHALAHLILSRTLRGRYCYYLYSVSGKTARSHGVTKWESCDLNLALSTQVLYSLTSCLPAGCPGAPLDLLQPWPALLIVSRQLGSHICSGSIMGSALGPKVVSPLQKVENTSVFRGNG